MKKNKKQKVKSECGYFIDKHGNHRSCPALSIQGCESFCDLQEDDTYDSKGYSEKGGCWRSRNQILNGLEKLKEL